MVRLMEWKLLVFGPLAWLLPQGCTKLGKSTIYLSTIFNKTNLLILLIVVQNSHSQVVLHYRSA